MTPTTQGLMTPADLADHRELTDTHPHPDCPGHDLHGHTVRCLAVQDCPGEPEKGKPMGTTRRLGIYGPRLTPRRRRRLLKKAGRDPEYAVIRDTGMGFSPAMQGCKELVRITAPVSGAPR